ncbi:MAG: hypothetical protein AAF723_07155, partial [Pseudomonadota bacterium]
MLDLTTKLTPLATKGRIATIFTRSDEIADRAFRDIVEPSDVTVYSARTEYTDDEPDENGDFHFNTDFKAVAHGFPDTERLDILAFSCTSGTVATGREGIRKKLEDARPGLKYTSPGIAMIKALDHMGAKKIGLLTPYPQYMHDMFIPFLEEGGIAVTSDGKFEVADEDISLISVESIIEGAREVSKTGNLDAIYISCTALNITPYIQQIEQELKLPVLASVQVMAWDCLNMLGLKRDMAEF